MSSFEVSRRDEESVSVIDIKGYLDAHTAPVLEKEIQNLIDADKFNIVVNFNELDYISSAGLGVFMGFIEDVRDKKGDIKLTNMTNKVFKVFDLLGFPAIYEIFKDEKEAVMRFKVK